MIFDSTFAHITTVNNKLDSINKYYDKLISLHGYNNYPIGGGNSVIENKKKLIIKQTLSNITIKTSELADKSHIVLYNYYGEEYYRQNQMIAEELTIDISSYPTGLYFVQIGNYFDKFMVVR